MSESDSIRDSYVTSETSEEINSFRDTFEYEGIPYVVELDGADLVWARVTGNGKTIVVPVAFSNLILAAGVHRVSISEILGAKRHKSINEMFVVFYVKPTKARTPNYCSFH
jgi:hypothetical protein